MITTDKRVNPLDYHAMKTRFVLCLLGLLALG